MGKANRDDARAAQYRANQRREAAAAKAEKERKQREDYWSRAVVPQYNAGGVVYSGGTIMLSPGVHIVGNTVWGSTWVRSDDYTQVELQRSESTELIVGYRMWPLSRSFPDGYRLGALNTQFGTFEPHVKQTAECKAGQRHEAPHEGCNCGIHAYSKSVPLEHQSTPYAAGEVNLWGKVIVHSDGYRAQYAYPKRLYVIDGGARADKIADALSWAYGVPCEPWDG